VDDQQQCRCDCFYDHSDAAYRSNVVDLVSEERALRSLQLLPAVDIASGRAVNLERSAIDGDDPLRVASLWREHGAAWIHLVDLDQAYGRGSNQDLLNQVIGEIGIPVQLSGGIIDAPSLERALSTGASRIVLGAGALMDIDWVLASVKEHGERLAIALDVAVAEGELSLRPRGTDVDLGPLSPVLERLTKAQAVRLIVTDVSLDGTMSGVNSELLQQVCAASPARVIASGGVGGLDDLSLLRGLTGQGVEGAIVGRALYAGAFTLSQAIEIAGDQR
jgi:phosphoribosyl isomerase A